MKSAFVALCIFGCAYAASLDKDAQVRAYSYEQQPEGNFQYYFDTDNDIQGQAEGKVKVFGKDEVALEITGSNQYKSPDGDVFAITYVANENGYQPQGNHLPTPPAPLEIPEYIKRALDYIATHPYDEKKN